MSTNKEIQTAVTRKQPTCEEEELQQQQQSTIIIHDRRILLIRGIRKRPRLYKNEFLRTPFLQRHEKQQIWDEIAKEARFYKIEDAKCKWRSLVNYLRQHLEHVAQKKQRRYIPNTQNSDDRYIQLNDWPYYKELEFLVPYVKYAATKQHTTGDHRMNPTSNEIDLIINAIEEDLDSKVDQPEVKTNANSSHSHTVIYLNNGEDDLAAEDIVLRDFFENMLKSTLSLPRFHQNRITNQLTHIINEQQEK